MDSKNRFFFTLNQTSAFYKVFHYPHFILSFQRLKKTTRNSDGNLWFIRVAQKNVNFDVMILYKTHNIHKNTCDLISNRT